MKQHIFRTSSSSSILACKSRKAGFSRRLGLGFSSLLVALLVYLLPVAPSLAAVPDGTVDPTFKSGSGPNSPVRSIAVQSDGKILLGGVGIFDNTAQRGLARLNADGSLDTSFNLDPSANYIPSNLVLQSDDKLLILTYNNAPRCHLARLNTDGSRDTSFGGGGIPGECNHIALQNDSKILVGGRFTSQDGLYHSRLARFNSDGILDTTFNLELGSNPLAWVDSLAVQPDGKILLSGYSYDSATTSRLVRVNPNGSLDTTFNPGTGPSSPLDAIAIQSDGKILIGGIFASYNGVPRKQLARLNSDGSLDTTFNPGGGVDGGVASLAIQSDGKIIIGGNFSTYNGISHKNIARLNSDGSLDTTFNSGVTSIDSYAPVYSIVVQDDDKILVGGEFQYCNGTPCLNLIRLNPDGNLDTTFTSPPGSNVDINSNYVSSIVVQRDGKILVGGSLTDDKWNVHSWLVRLNNDGSLDTSFKNGVSYTSFEANSSVSSIAVQRDGKIIIGSNFPYGYRPNISALYSVNRLNSDGSRDNSFSAGGGDGYVNSLALQGDGKILIAGRFGSYNGTERRYIARLNSNGSLDTNFTTDVGYGLEGIRSLVLQNDGKILIGGSFDHINSYTRDKIARLENTVVKSSTSIELTSSVNPAALGQSVTFTATLTPLEATGTLTFTFANNTGSTSVVRPLVNGVATYTAATLPAGDTAVTVSYGGDSRYAPSSSLGYNQHVGQVSLSSSVNPAVVGTVVTFKASVQSPIAKGLVTFTFTRKGQNSITTSVTTRLSEGVASYMTNTLPSGSYTVTVNYAGNTGYPGSFAQSFTQGIIADCTDKVVSSTTDDGEATTCGTLSYAFATTTSGTINLALASGNTIAFTSDLRYPLAPGVTLDGGENGLILDGKGVAGDSLRLGGGNRLANLTIRNFGGRELIAIAANSTPNQLFKVKIES